MPSFLPHIFGATALLIWIISLQLDKKYKMLFLQLISNVLYGIQYTLLGFFSASSMNLVSIIRCYIFGKNSKKNKKTPLWLLWVFISAILFLAVIYCKSLLDFVPIVAGLLFTVSSWQESTRIICFSCLLAAIFLALYNFTVGTYINLCGNIFEITSAIIAIVRSYSKKESEVN